MANAVKRKPINVESDIHYTISKLVLDKTGINIGDEASARLRESLQKDGIMIESMPSECKVKLQECS